MGKWVNDSVLDVALDKIGTATQEIVTRTQPADRAAALADALATANLTGAFTKSDGVSGRKTTIAQQAAVNVTATGSATHVCLIDGANLLYVTTVTTPQTLTAGNTVTIPAWTVTIADPS